METQYFTNRSITSEQYKELLQQTTLGTRRPLENKQRIDGMLVNSNLLVTAWNGEKLVGLARSVTDFHYCCYLSDLAVAEFAQLTGIGKELIRQTFRKLKPGCKLILLSAPQSVEYYPKIGFTRHDSAWILEGIEKLL